MTAEGMPFSTRVMNLAHFLDQTARRFPDAPAIIRGEQRWSWAEFAAQVEASAHVLATEGGIGRRDPVLVQSPNGVTMWATLWAYDHA